MSEHHASISWRQSDAGFRRGRFSRAHRWRFDGGIEIPASAAPAVIPAPWSEAAAIDPEEAFVAALASCHMMSFLHLANRAGFEVTAYDDEAVGILGQRADGRPAIVRVTLRPRACFAPGAQPDAATLASLHAQAHDGCYIANSVATEILVEPRTPE